jgi:hypothetical protein
MSRTVPWLVMFWVGFGVGVYSGTARKPAAETKAERETSQPGGPITLTVRHGNETVTVFADSEISRGQYEELVYSLERYDWRAEAAIAAAMADGRVTEAEYQDIEQRRKVWWMEKNQEEWDAALAAARQKLADAIQTRQPHK